MGLQRRLQEVSKKKRFFNHMPMIDACVAMREQPWEIRKLAVELSVTEHSLRRFVYRLHEERFAYIAEWIKSNYSFVPLYAFGKGLDAEYPGAVRPPIKVNWESHKYPMQIPNKFIAMLKALRKGAKPISELETYCYINNSKLSLILAYGNEKRLFRIARWERQPENAHCAGIARVWAIGSAKDAPKPPKQTKAESLRKFREAQKRKNALLQRGPMSIFNLAVL